MGRSFTQKKVVTERRKANIIDLIENGETEAAFEILKTLSFEEHDEIVLSLWYSNYNDLIRRNNLGILEEEHLIIGKNKVKNNLLEFIKKHKL